AARSADRRTTLRSQTIGWIHETPSSTDFWMIQSILSASGRPWTSPMARRGSGSTSRQAPTFTSTRSRSMRWMAASYSPPLPSKTVIASPAFRRSARPTCCAASGASANCAPGPRRWSQWMRGSGMSRCYRSEAHARRIEQAHAERERAEEEALRSLALGDVAGDRRDRELHHHEGGDLHRHGDEPPDRHVDEAHAVLDRRGERDDEAQDRAREAERGRHV